jgi:predicted TIM-barrel fold metal-dependent hydrolase
MKIDIFAHVIPPKFKGLLYGDKKGGGFALKEHLSNYPTLFDLEHRFRIMDKHPDVIQVVTLSGVSVDELAEPKEAAILAQRANDEMAELVRKYPDRFAAGVATVSMRDIDGALKELDRAINDLNFRGIQLRIPVNGKPVDSPEFFPLYEKMCQYNLPIWWHPEGRCEVPNYEGEKESKYWIWHLWGLPFETTVSMTRIVMGGIFEKFPKLKIITHHCGAMVPFFAERIRNHYNFLEMRNKMGFHRGLTEHPVEYFRRFYNDTAILGNPLALMCAYDFFGADRLLFGTDVPFDPTLGDYGTGRTVKAIEQMDIPEGDKKKIFEDNARKLLRLPV